MSSMCDLSGKCGLIVGIANDQSIAYGCARACRAAGAELAVTYLNEKAEPHVRPLGEALASPLILPCDVRVAGQLENVFEQIGHRWGRLDFLLHAIAFAPREDLRGRLADCSLDGFLVAMDVSCHSFIRMAKLAEPLMGPRGGTLLTLSFYGAEKAVENYDVMGPPKAALECAVRYLAIELGSAGIRVNAISPATIQTRAASGLKDFDQMIAQTYRRLPGREPVTIEDVGPLAAFLASDAARTITGEILHVDCGYHALG
jgi:enoyl-[acyl-carrier protein] reductase I